MCANLTNLEHDIRIYEDTGVDYIHLDVMDSTFVKNLTFGPDSALLSIRIQQLKKSASICLI